MCACSWLEKDKLLGRTLLCPADFFDEPCLEYEGRGWAVLVMKKQGRAGTIKFKVAKLNRHFDVDVVLAWQPLK